MTILALVSLQQFPHAQTLERMTDLQGPVSHNLVEELPARHELHDDVDLVLLGRHHLLQVHNVRMICAVSVL